MATQQAAVRLIATLFSTGDLRVVDLLVAGEFVDHQQAAWPNACGPAAFKQVVITARHTFPNLRVMVTDMFAVGAYVVASWHWHSTDEDGKSFDRDTIEIVRFWGGHVVGHWGATLSSACSSSRSAQAASDPGAHGVVDRR